MTRFVIRQDVSTDIQVDGVPGVPGQVHFTFDAGSRVVQPQAFSAASEVCDSTGL